jgi:hypothetical protein
MLPREAQICLSWRPRFASARSTTLLFGKEKIYASEHICFSWRHIFASMRCTQLCFLGEKLSFHKNHKFAFLWRYRFTSARITERKKISVLSRESQICFSKRDFFLKNNQSFISVFLSFFFLLICFGFHFLFYFLGFFGFIS